MSLTWTLIDAFLAIGAGAPVDAELFEEIKTNVNLVAAPPSGNSTFNGMTGRVITIADQGGVTYHVSITPTADTGGNLGDVFVVRNSATQFTVYNRGTFTGAFSYEV